MVASPASSSSLDSDYEEMEEGMSGLTEEDQQIAMDLVCRSVANPYDYDLHMETIAKLASNPLFVSQLEQQFDRFSAAYPLTLDLWLQYIALNPSKMEEAFEDYLQPELYYKYIEDMDITDDDADSKWNRVLQALGSHWNESEKIYGMYRTYLKDTIEDIEQQTNRIRSSYRDQLANPYFDGSERVLSEYRAWIQFQNFKDKNIPGELQSIERSIRGQKSPLQKMTEFERQIEKCDPNDSETLQSVWLSYVQFAVQRVKILGCGLVKTIFERAVASVCLSALLWQQYLDFLDEMKIDALGVAKRVTRNVPYLASAWVTLAVQMELRQEPADSLSQVITELINRKPCPMQLDQLLEVILSYCDAIRRSRDHDLLHDLFNLAKTALGEWQAGKNVLLMYEAKTLGENTIVGSKLSRQWVSLWEEVLTTQGESLQTWQTCIAECQRVGGTIQETRSYYKRGVEIVQDYPSVLAESWVQFEREFGDDVKEWQKARKSYDNLAKKMSEQHSNQVMTENAPGAGTVAPEQNAAQANPTTETKTDNLKATKKAPLKRKHSDSNAKQEEYKKQRLQEETHERTLFLCELNKATTKEDLMQLFSACGNVKEVRLVIRNRESNVSRGMAYVEFADEETAKKALELNGTEFHGAPLNIQISKPTAPKPAKLTEKDSVWKTCQDTIYVTGIADLTELQLQEFFAKIGQVKNVAIMGRKLQKKEKQYALIEFADKETVTKMLEQEDKFIIVSNDEEHLLQIKRSRFSIAEIQQQQAKSKQTNEKLKQEKKSTGKPKDQPANPPLVSTTTKSAPALRLSMKPIVPRSLKVVAKGTPQPQVTAVEASTSKREEPKSQQSEPTKQPSTGNSKMKSNADFRKLFQ